MSANVESMFYTDADGRHAPWHGLGVRVLEAPTSADALTVAGLDWKVEQAPTYFEVDGRQIPTGMVVNYRDTDKAVLGTVSDRYCVVQNDEAFAFTDALVGGDVRYETAGSLNGGRVVWLLARMPERNILGDTIEPYLVFANSHDGSSSVKCIVTNVRVVCQNTLNFALGTAKRTWSVVHKGDVQSKVEEARLALELANSYNTEFAKHAERLAMTRLSSADVHKILDAVFPIEEDKTEIKLNNLIKLRDRFFACYNAADLSNFRGTGWGVMNAFSDLLYHGGATLRKTARSAERPMMSVIGGNALFDKAHSLILAAA